MYRNTLVSKVEKKLIYFLQKMIKSKRLTASLLKKKPTWSFIQTIIITTFALRVLLRDGINHGNKRLHWKGTEGGGEQKKNQRIRDVFFCLIKVRQCVRSLVLLFGRSFFSFVRSLRMSYTHTAISSCFRSLFRFFVYMSFAQ